MVIPYLTFSGNCKEALELYQEAFKETVGMLQLYGDYVPEGAESIPGNINEWVLHAEMNICGTPFWFADELKEFTQEGTKVKLAVSVLSMDEAKTIFDILKEGAQITLPPTQTFYSKFHAGLIDKYGIGWNVVAEA